MTDLDYCHNSTLSIHSLAHLHFVRTNFTQYGVYPSLLQQCIRFFVIKLQYYFIYCTKFLKIMCD